MTAESPADSGPSPPLRGSLSPQAGRGWLEEPTEFGFIRPRWEIRPIVHQIFPSVDLNVSPDWEFNALTRATDRAIVKVRRL